MKEFRKLGQDYTLKWFSNISWRTNWQGKGWRQKWEMSREWGWALRCALCPASLGLGVRRKEEQHLPFCCLPQALQGASEQREWESSAFPDNQERVGGPASAGRGTKVNTVSWGVSTTRLLLTGPLRPDQSGGDTAQGSLKIHFWYPKWILHPENYVLKEFQAHIQRA